MKTVTVQFSGSSARYAYHCKYDVEIGQTVVVDSPSTGYTCVRVADIRDFGSLSASKHVVCVVDDTQYKDDIAKEEKRSGILKSLAEIDKTVSEQQRYRHLANIPEAKELLAQLDKLSA